MLIFILHATPDRLLMPRDGAIQLSRMKRRNGSFSCRRGVSFSFELLVGGWNTDASNRGVLQALIVA